MQVYKMFFRVAKAKIPSIIPYVIVFLVLSVLLSNIGTSNNTEHFEVSSVEICIIDEDESSASLALTDYLTSMHKRVSFDSYEKELLQDSLYYQKISYILTIPKGFEEALLSGKTNGIVETSKRLDSANGYFIDQQIENYLSNLSLLIIGGFSLEEATSFTAAALSETPETKVAQFGKKAESENTQMYYFFQYFPYVIIMMLIEGLAPIIIAFQKPDIAARINCSSFPQSAKNIQLGLGFISYSMFIWTAFMLFGTVIYGVADVFSRSGLLCILNSLVFTLVATAITLLVGNFQLNNNILNMVANVLGLSMSFLCGVFVPQWLLGDAVLSFSRFLPMYWYIRITNMLSGFSGEAVSMETYWISIGVQMLFFSAIFAVYLAMNRYYSLLRLRCMR